jgi:hypothetical protein
MARSIWDDGYIFIIAFFFAVAGYIETRPFLILWLAKQDPLMLIVDWYALVYGPLLFLAGRKFMGKRFNARYVVALLMVTWAVFIIYWWPASGYVDFVTGTTSSSVLLSSEDGATYFLAMKYLTSNPATAAFITYVVVPPALILGAAYLASPSMVKKEFHRLVAQP